MVFLFFDKIFSSSYYLHYHRKKLKIRDKNLHFLQHFLNDLF